MEYCDKNIYYVKRKPKKIKRFFKLILTFFILAVILLYYKYFITENVIKIVEDTVYSYSTDSVNNAVLYSLDDKISYENIITVEKNANGDIVLLKADSYKINSINRNVAKNSEFYLKEKLNGGVSIPALSFTGINLISGYGTKVKYKSVNISSVVCEFKNKFKESGINQTIHSIYLKVKCSVKIDIPLNSRTVINETDVLLCETVLIGKVPEVYLSDNFFTT